MVQCLQVAGVSDSPEFIHLESTLISFKRKSRNFYYKMKPMRDKEFRDFVELQKGKHGWSIGAGTVVGWLEDREYSFLGDSSAILFHLQKRYYSQIVLNRENQADAIRAFQVPIQPAYSQTRESKKICIWGAGCSKTIAGLMVHLLVQTPEIGSWPLIVLYDRHRSAQVQLTSLVNEIGLPDIVLTTKSFSSSLYDADLLIIIGDIKRSTKETEGATLIRMREDMLRLGFALQKKASPRLRILLMGMPHSCLMATALTETLTLIPPSRILVVTSHLGLMPLSYVMEVLQFKPGECYSPPVWGIPGKYHLIDVKGTGINLAGTSEDQPRIQKAPYFYITVPKTLWQIAPDLSNFWKYVSRHKDNVVAMTGEDPYLAEVNATLGILTIWFNEAHNKAVVSAGVRCNGLYGLPPGLYMSQPAERKDGGGWGPAGRESTGGGSLPPRDPLLSLSTILKNALATAAYADVGRGFGADWIARKDKNLIDLKIVSCFSTLKPYAFFDFEKLKLFPVILTESESCFRVLKDQRVGSKKVPPLAKNKQLISTFGTKKHVKKQTCSRPKISWCDEIEEWEREHGQHNPRVESNVWQFFNDTPGKNKEDALGKFKNNTLSSRMAWLEDFIGQSKAEEKCAETKRPCLTDNQRSLREFIEVRLGASKYTKRLTVRDILIEGTIRVWEEENRNSMELEYGNNEKIMESDFINMVIQAYKRYWEDGLKGWDIVDKVLKSLILDIMKRKPSQLQKKSVHEEKNQSISLGALVEEKQNLLRELLKELWKDEDLYERAELNTVDKMDEFPLYGTNEAMTIWGATNKLSQKEEKKSEITTKEEFPKRANVNEVELEDHIKSPLTSPRNAHENGEAGGSKRLQKQSSNSVSESSSLNELMPDESTDKVLKLSSSSEDLSKGSKFLQDYCDYRKAHQQSFEWDKSDGKNGYGILYRQNFELMDEILLMPPELRKRLAHALKLCEELVARERKFENQ